MATESEEKHAYDVSIGSDGKTLGKYRIEEQLGRGANGVVWAAITGKEEPVAIKKIAGVLKNSNQSKRAIREVRLLRHLRHPNVISIHDLILEPSQEEFQDIYIVTERMEFDLQALLYDPDSAKGLTDDHYKLFMYQILRGLKYIHSAGVIHRDLKPNNLLIRRDPSLIVVKLCDFGLSRVMNVQQTIHVQAHCYRAPEVYLNEGCFGQEIDIWSVGCIFAEMLSKPKRPLFMKAIDGPETHLESIVQFVGSPSIKQVSWIPDRNYQGFLLRQPKQAGVPFREYFPGANSQGLDLLEKMLKFDPRERITVEEAICHPYLQEWHLDSDEPTAPGLLDGLDFRYEEDENTTIEKYREILYHEKTMLENLAKANEDIDRHNRSTGQTQTTSTTDADDFVFVEVPSPEIMVDSAGRDRGKKRVRSPYPEMSVTPSCTKKGLFRFFSSRSKD